MLDKQVKIMYIKRLEKFLWAVSSIKERRGHSSIRIQGKHIITEETYAALFDVEEENNYSGDTYEVNEFISMLFLGENKALSSFIEKAEARLGDKPYCIQLTVCGKDKEGESLDGVFKWEDLNDLKTIIEFSLVDKYELFLMFRDPPDVYEAWKEGIGLSRYNSPLLEGFSYQEIAAAFREIDVFLEKKDDWPL